MASLVLTDSPQLTANSQKLAVSCQLSAVSCQSAPKKPWGYFSLGESRDTHAGHVTEGCSLIGNLVLNNAVKRNMHTRVIEVDGKDDYIKTVDQDDREDESNSDIYACKWGKEVEPFCEKPHNFETGAVGSAPQNNANKSKEIQQFVSDSRMINANKPKIIEDLTSKVSFDSGMGANTFRPYLRQDGMESELFSYELPVVKTFSENKRYCVSSNPKIPKWCVENQGTDSNAELTTPEIIEKYGYTAQTHTVVTEDSYILTLHRIPGRQINQDDGVKPRVVLVLHGLLASSATFVELGPEKGLGFILSDEGFDVWLGNFRGNTYSREHVRPDIPHHVYWNFSMHEMGQYDIPAMIDYILNITGQKHLQIVAHSTGATSCYIMVCLHTKYSAKISLLTSIAPLGPSGFLDPILKKEVKLLADRMMAMLSKNDVHYFAPSYDWLANYTAWFCQKDLLDDNLCKIRRLLGFNSKKLSESDLSVVSSHFPAGTSVKFMIHLAQIMTIRPTAHFRRYDYGPVENLYYYADITPPSYDVSVGVPLLSIVYSMVDMVAPEEENSTGCLANLRGLNKLGPQELCPLLPIHKMSPNILKRIDEVKDYFIEDLISVLPTEEKVLLSSDYDVRNFAIYFPSVETFYVVEEFWNNMDFTWADDLKYDPGLKEKETLVSYFPSLCFTLNVVVSRGWRERGDNNISSCERARDLHGTETVFMMRTGESKDCGAKCNTRPSSPASPVIGHFSAVYCYTAWETVIKLSGSHSDKAGGSSKGKDAVGDYMFHLSTPSKFNDDDTLHIMLANEHELIEEVNAIALTKSIPHIDCKQDSSHQRYVPLIGAIDVQQLDYGRAFSFVAGLTRHRRVARDGRGWKCSCFQTGLLLPTTVVSLETDAGGSAVVFTRGCFYPPPSCR
uniref:Partial AB-hydrolase lipase domain-containing protein n=1 Tax=Timema bartmani TaxID=61472 RepID=A0A7R9EPP6_9NEOP|nr:unnamed protein product [Timema bartmani]